MPFVGDSYLVREIDAKSWALQESLVYQGAREMFTVPVGFCTDFTSVPRIFTWLIPRTGVYSRVAIVHDYLIMIGLNPTDRDGIFRRMLREYGVSFPRRWMMWAAVRTWSGMRAASFVEWMQYAGVVLLAVPFLLIPTIVVSLWSAMFWIFESLFPRTAR